MTMETSKLVESMSADLLAHKRVFEGSMIANEIYKDAVYDESGLLYTKLALSNCLKDPKKSKTYATESHNYLRKKIAHQQDEIKTILEKLEKIIDDIKNQRETDLLAGEKEVQELSKFINKNLISARTQYLQTLKSH